MRHSLIIILSIFGYSFINHIYKVIIITKTLQIYKDIVVIIKSL